MLAKKSSRINVDVVENSTWKLLGNKRLYFRNGLVRISKKYLKKGGSVSKKRN